MALSQILRIAEPSALSRSLIRGLEDKVDWSNYDYSKLKKKEERRKGKLLYKMFLIFVHSWNSSVWLGGWEHVAYNA